MASNPAANYRQQIRNTRLAAKVLDELKIASGCVDCGFNAWPEALHFDHVDPESKQLSLGWKPDRSRLTSRIKLQKYLDHVERYCVIRCANCHAHRTKQERHYFLGHIEQRASSSDPTLF